MPNRSQLPYAVPAPDDGEDIQFIDQAPQKVGWESAPLVSDSQPDEGEDIQFIDQAPQTAGWESAPLDEPGFGDYSPSSFLGKALHVANKTGVFGLAGHLLARGSDNPQSNPQPKVASGVWEAAKAGYESSATGLLTSGHMPDLVLDPEHARWYEKLAAGGAQMAADLPVMFLGGAAAGLLGIESGPGAAVAAGAGAFAVPTLIRSALTEAYSKGSVRSSGDFLLRTGIVIKETGTDALIGGLTGGAGALARGAATGAITKGASWAMTRGENLAVNAATAGAEYTAMTVSPALLQGRLPEPEDFTNAAILMVGMKGAHMAAGKVRSIYARTGIRPEQVVADSQTNPRIAEALKAEDLEIPEVYRALASAAAAVDALPGVKARQVLDQPFAAIPETKLPYQLNLKYIEGPEDLRALQTRMAEVYRADIDAARGGTRSWAETGEIAARQVADLTGRDIQKVMAGRQAGDTANDIQLKIMGDTLMQATVDAGEAIRRVKAAGNEATDTMRLEALEAIHKTAMIQADFTGASSELGRALNYLKQIKELKAQGEGISKLVEQYGGDPAALLEAASKLDSPEKLARFAREATKAATWDQIIEAWKSGLVSGPITQTANFMGNVSFLATRPAVDAVASLFGMASRTPERVAAIEPLARIFGNIQGVADGLRLAKVAFMEDSAGIGSKTEHRHAIPGTAGYVVRTPFRALSAGDALFRAMNERGEAYTLAAREAVKEGHNISTREFRIRVAELTNDPTEAMAKEIKDAGARFVFNAPLGEKGRAIQQLVRSWHLEWAVPFISTPGNVFKEMARLTPAAPIIGEWRTALAKGGPEAQKALAEMALGTSLSALTMGLATAGHISGNGDPDPNKRRVQQAAGWQPYSVKLNGTWYSYQRFQPVGTLLGLAADMAEVWEHLTPEESDKVPKILATAFANSVTNQTFLQGMATLVDALGQPDQKGPRLLQNLAGSAIPAVLGQTAQMMDPFQREIASIQQAVQNRIPGLRESLPPQRDPFGEPIPSQDRLGGISPVTIREQSEDKVRIEAARLGVAQGKAPKSISLPAGGIEDIGRVDLTPEQRDIFGDVAGHMAYKVMSQMVSSPGWERMPDTIKEKAYKIAFEMGHKYGKMMAISPEQRQREIQRIVGEISERLKSAQ